jgi:predicted nucleotidyltransferase
LPIPFSKIRFENLEEILKVLKEALSRLGIDFYLIDAVARDIQLTGKHDIRAPRATRDIDIAILVNNQDLYEQLVHALINEYDFVDTDLPYRFKYLDGTLIDILPFGEIESDERTVTLQGRQIEELSVIGFQENLAHTEEVEFEDGFKIQVSSLAGICLLKFFAWGDKPDSRERDVNDINFILSKYTTIYIDEIFDRHPDLLGLNWDINLPPRLLGRHIGLILKDQKDSKNRLTILLSEQLKEDSRLPELLTRFNNWTMADNINLIQEIITGVNE